MAKSFGKKVIVINSVTSRLEQAKKFVAHEVIIITDYPTLYIHINQVRSITSGKGASIAMELTAVV